MKAKRIIKKFSSSGIIYRIAKKNKSRLKYFIAKRIQNDVLDVNYFLNKFSEIGIKPGDMVIINSSLSAMGSVKDGPQSLIDALKEYLTKDGLIVMSTYPHTNMFRYLENYEVFDVKNTPSKNGFITEIFRNNDNVIRSLHPTHCLAAWGNNAQDIMKGHELSLSPYDFESPYKKLLDLDVKILLIGVNLNHAVMIRVIDDLYPDYPLNPYIPNKLYTVKIKDYNGRILEVTTPCHDPIYSKERNNMIIFPYIKNKITLGKLGSAFTWVFSSQYLFKTQIELSKKGIFPFYQLPLKNRLTANQIL